MARTDLHCHILPGVDDGPQTMDESVAYAAEAVAAGTGTVIATPHVELVDVQELPDRVGELRDRLRARGVALDVRVGGELRPSSVAELSQDELELIAHGPPGARWLLFEAPFHGVDELFGDAARELRARGFGLVIAHPERSRGILDEGLRVLEAEIRAGARVAANVDPLGGGEGAARRAAAEQLMRRGIPDVVATDAHPPHRPHTLAMAHDAVARATGRTDLARRLTDDAPTRLLAEGIATRRDAA